MDTTVVIDTLALVVPDSVKAIVSATQLVQGTAPWLDPQIVNWLAHAMAGIPILGMIFAYEFVRKLIATHATKLSFITKPLEKFSVVINPILGAIIGGQMGDSVLGMAAATVWGMIRNIPVGKKATLGGLTKAKNVVAIILLGTCLASTSYAADPKTEEMAKQWNTALNPQGLMVIPIEQSKAPGTTVRWLAKERFSFGLGAGQRFEFRSHELTPTGYDKTEETHGFGAVQLGYAIFDHIGIRSRVDRDLKWEVNNWNIEASAWLIF